jgi:hypothetical protein
MMLPRSSEASVAHSWYRWIIHSKYRWIIGMPDRNLHSIEYADRTINGRTYEPRSNIYLHADIPRIRGRFADWGIIRQWRSKQEVRPELLPQKFHVGLRFLATLL